MEAVQNGSIPKDALIMLNITGGGEERFKRGKELYYLEPDVVFDIDPDSEEVKKTIESLY